MLWLGNAAKAKVISAILAATSGSSSKIIFDYGCGSGGDWPRILSQYRNLHLIGYDPSPKRIEAARTKLVGFNAQLLSRNQLKEQTFKADYVVSFSVLEHVYDRRAYLQTAKKHLHEDGTFYLNYDDGHFRNVLDLTDPSLWAGQISEWMHNLLAGPLARVGRTSGFQERVSRPDMDRLVDQVGFCRIDEFYSNVSSLKNLYKLLPEDKRADYMRLWLTIEDELNAKYLVHKANETMGDSANIWPVMNSRTLVLRHSA